MAGLKDQLTERFWDLSASIRQWLEFRRDPIQFCLDVANQGEAHYRQGDYIAAARHFLFVVRKMEAGNAMPADLAVLCYSRAGAAIASIKPNPDPQLAARLLGEAVTRAVAMGAGGDDVAGLRVYYGHALIDARRAKEALEEFQLAAKERPNSTDRLSGVADALQGMGDFAGAVAAWGQLIVSLQGMTESQRQPLHAQALERRGQLHIDAHQYEEAAQDLAAATFGYGLGREFATHRLSVLASLTWVNGSLGRLAEAEASALAWRQLVEEVGKGYATAQQEVRMLSGLGWAHVLAKQPKDALPLFAKAIAVQEQTGATDAFLLYRYGAALVEAGDVQEAAAVSRRSLAALNELDSLTAFFVYGQLARHLLNEKRFDASIFFHKMNLSLRRALGGTQDATPLTAAIDFSNERFFRELGDALISRGRLAEAEQIGRVLEDMEISGMIGRSFALDPREIALTFTLVEQEWRGELEAAIARVQQAHDRNLTTSNWARRPPPSPSIPEARAALAAWVDTLKDADAHRGARQVNMLEFAGGQPPEGVLLVKTLTSRNAMHVVLSFGQQQTFVTPEITVEAIAERIFLLRRAMIEPGGDVAAHAAMIYKILGLGIFDQLCRDAREIAAAAPAEAQARLAPTLIAFDLDGPCRYLPIAALWDGDGWLIERVAVMRVGREMPIGKWRATQVSGLERNERGIERSAPASVVAFGTTQAHHGLPALPGVRDEIAAIVRGEEGGVMPGVALLDAQFTRYAMRTILPRHPLVHIATHFEFHPSLPHRSGLLLGDGSVLPLGEFWGHKFDFSTARLVTLSACETGLAGADPVLAVNLASIVRMLGAELVAATLWRVGDQAAARLMSHFYAELAVGVSPVEALRSAQLALIGRPARAWDEPRLNAPDATGAWSAPFSWSGIFITGAVEMARCPLSEVPSVG